MFLHPEVKEFNNHHISSDLRSLSDHAPLLVLIIIEKEFIKEEEQRIVKKKRNLLKSLEAR